MKQPRRAGVSLLVTRRWGIVCALLLGATSIAYCSGDDVTRPSSRPAVTTTSLSAGGVGVAYSMTLAANGGDGKYVWTLVSGSLPAGLQLGESGAIVGTPTGAGSFGFTVQVSSARASATRSFTLDIAAQLQITSTGPLPSGIVGQRYHAPLTVVGGDSTNHWSVVAGTLPNGLTLSAAGVITGTPAGIDTAEFEVRVANALGQATTSPVTLTTLATPAVTTSALPPGAIDVAYQASLAASGGDGTYVWVLAGPGLPPGLTLAADGVIAGTPAGAGNFEVAVEVSSAGASATRVLTLDVAPALHITSTTPLPSGIVGRPYQAALAATGGDASNEWSLAAGALPEGLTLSAAGVIDGVPTAVDTAVVDVRIANTLGQATTAQITLITLAELVVTTSSLSTGAVGVAYQAQLVASGGDETYVWTLAGGSLPDGVTLATDGSITGTATAAGTHTLLVQVASAGVTATRELTLTIASVLQIAPTTPPPVVVGRPYSFTWTASGGEGPNVWSLASGVLPAGLALSADGVLAGIAAAAGTTEVVVSATNALGQIASAATTLVVVMPLTVSTATTTAIAPVVLGQTYTVTLTAAGGASPFSWSMVDGSLPAGLVLSVDGVISGTPTEAGMAVFRVAVVDRYGLADTTELRLEVLAAPPEPPAITTTALATPALLGQSYTATLAAGGGAPPLGWSLAGGSLPAGLVLSVDGVISGTPTEAGMAVFRVAVVDRYGLADTTELSLEVLAAPPEPPAITTTSLAAPAVLGQSYTVTLAAASGGAPPLSWSLAGGSLPTGLVLGADGVISGTPTEAGMAVFRVAVVDGYGLADTTELSLEVLAAPPEPPAITTTSLAAPAVLGQSYTATLAASGGAAPLSWSLAGGSLPTGLVLGADGVISGTPTEAGMSVFRVAIVDRYGLTDTTELSLEVLAAPPEPPAITTTSLAAPAVLGQSYTATLAASGGAPPLSWRLAGGSLPAGLVLGADGVISGTPTEAGMAVFRVAVVDRYGLTDTTELSLEVLAAPPEPPAITTTSLAASAVLGQSYTATLAASGGAPPLGWSLAGGSLPAGLVLGADGVISGTPTEAGMAGFRVAVVDRYGLTDTTELSLDVLVPPPEPPTTVPNLRVAFIGDQGSGADAVSVLQLIRDEGADMVIHAGDFDYDDDPTQWDATITSVLGAGFPYFATVGNHDDSKFYGTGGYQEKLAQRLARVPDATCTGDLGVNSTCRYQGLFFILSGVGTLGSGHEAYLRQELAADHSIWRICSWHKNQNAMQVGAKGDEVGWGAYETCRELGAIIATAHEHSYSRTRTLVNTQLQTVDPAWPTAESVRVTPGATFVFVSALGGQSIRDQERCLPSTFPYGCNGEWASIYTSNQGASSGALFIDFHVDGDAKKARGYFKNIDGAIVDQFTITSQPGPR